MLPSRIAVIGAGAFGRNHLRVWRELERSGLPVRLSAVVDSNFTVAEKSAAEFGVPAFQSLDDLLASQQIPDAASVCVPTSLHCEITSRLLRSGADVLLEKPIAVTLDEADNLIEIANSHNRILQIGHLERFNPAVLAARSIVHRPLFFEIHRLSVFTPRSLDVDVVLDLMIHDLDIVLSFVQSPVRNLHAVGLPVLSSQVDIANVRIEFDSGCVANFTASRVSTERVRKMRFFQPHQYISVDYARQDVLCVDVAHTQTENEIRVPEASTSRPGFQPAERPHPTPEFSMEKLDVVPGEPLRLEIESFLQSIRKTAPPIVDGKAGRAALALALDIRAAIQSHRLRAGLT